MIKSVKIYNRFHMDCLLVTKGSSFPYKHWDLISIHTEPKDLYLTELAQAILKRFGMNRGISLRFSDVTDKQYEHIKQTITEKKYKDVQKKSSEIFAKIRLFSEQDAKKVINFIDYLQKNVADTILVIHCDAGISRSAAIGTFVTEHCNLDYDAFIKENPFIYSNPYLLDILRRLSNYQGVKHDGIDHKEGDFLNITRLKNKIRFTEK